ncbi:MAG: LysR substrate-binding domain-containing protein [Trebonia sp.]
MGTRSRGRSGIVGITAALSCPVGIDSSLWAAPDYVLSVIGPPLVRRVLVQSPAVTLHFGGWHEGVYQDVERGALDLAFTGGAAPPPLRSEPLFDDRYVCVMSAGHPLAAAIRAAAPTE